MRNRVWCRVVAAWAACLAVCLGVCVLAGPAWAEEGEPLTVTHFSVQATRTTVENHIGPETEFVNEPYEEPFDQAGAHPWGLTTDFEFATKNELSGDPGIWPTREPKNIVVGLPPGFVGNPMAVPRCSMIEALSVGECPASSQVGVYRAQLFGGKELVAPIADVVPERGQSAELAFLNDAKFSAVATGHLVRLPKPAGTPPSYGLTVVSHGLSAVQLYRLEVTIWGVPADPSHTMMRGLICGRVHHTNPLTCNFGTGDEESNVAPVPFLTLGTDCAAGAQRFTLRADSWEEPDLYTEASATLPPLTGCDLLSFDPRIEAQPDTLLADEPVGLNVNLQVPQDEAPAGLATSQVRDATITLPQGMSVNPGIVDGIRACEATGPEGINIEGPLSEETAANGELQLAPGDCPDASILGTAEAITPLLPTPVKGHVYLGRPDCGGAGQSPCTEEDVIDGKLYRLYLELGGTGELAQTGVHLKLEGDTQLDPATGQLTTRFLDNPQTPFSELKVHLNGGPRAPLANPPGCGPAVTSSDFTPWSAPGQRPVSEGGGQVSGIGDAAPTSFFKVEGCASPQPFAPRMLAGTTTPLAGRSGSFTLDLSREDREQYVKGLQVHLPPGLLAMLTSVPLCGDAQAEAGACPETSRIGTTRVASGAGSHPFEIEGGVYLTGPYHGAPFGLSIVTHVIAGPFNLGLVVVRARIDVDRENSTATITVDESGPHAIPQILFGVPLRLRRITTNIDRPGFMLNPTNCDAQHITAKVSGSNGALTEVSSPFAVAGCRGLAFKPKFQVFTNGRTSRAKGASLDTRLSYPAGALGNDANIARVKVALPRQLPSRLTTLQKACVAQTFDTDPAACPAASVVGVAYATTPVLAGRLSGPVYFVSHGGEAFPSLVIVLQGDGVRVDLTGTTFISKRGITSSTFKSLPDVPVKTFELYLPNGRYSALAANGNLCKSQSKLTMPTEFVAQNGLVIHRTTKIAVSGCRKARRAKVSTGKRGRGR